MERKELKPRYDVVIIGSGIGGLTAGALFSKAGFSVCVWKKNRIPVVILQVSGEKIFVSIPPSTGSTSIRKKEW